MKKTIFPLFVLTTLPVFAKTITANTQIKWNPGVVVAAAKAAGLEAFTEQDYSVYDEVLSVLLQEDTFSAIDATEVCKAVCMEYLNLEKVCQTACEDFGNELVQENNRQTTKSFSVPSDQPISLFKEIDGTCWYQDDDAEIIRKADNCNQFKNFAKLTPGQWSEFGKPEGSAQCRDIGGNTLCTCTDNSGKSNNDKRYDCKDKGCAQPCTSDCTYYCSSYPMEKEGVVYQKNNSKAQKQSGSNNIEQSKCGKDAEWNDEFELCECKATNEQFQENTKTCTKNVDRSDGKPCTVNDREFSNAENLGAEGAKHAVYYNNVCKAKSCLQGYTLDNKNHICTENSKYTADKTPQKQPQKQKPQESKPVQPGVDKGYHKECSDEDFKNSWYTKEGALSGWYYNGKCVARICDTEHGYVKNEGVGNCECDKSKGYKKDSKTGKCVNNKKPNNTTAESEKVASQPNETTKPSVKSESPVKNENKSQPQEQKPQESKPVQPGVDKGYHTECSDEDFKNSWYTKNAKSGWYYFKGICVARECNDGFEKDPKVGNCKPKKK